MSKLKEHLEKVVKTMESANFELNEREKAKLEFVKGLLKRINRHDYE